MAYGEDITDLQAVDHALGTVIAAAYTGLADTGPEAYRRFLKRPDAERIYFASNDDVQGALRKIARHENEPDKAGMDLPVVIYYREMSLVADMEQKTVQIGRTGYVRTLEGEENRMLAMEITFIPVTLTYSMLFLAWDRASLERMAIAWWGYVAPKGRKHSRFLVRYNFAGELTEIGASLLAPRDANTSSEQIGDSGARLWGMRSMIEVNTQALYGKTFVTPESVLVDNGAQSLFIPRLIPKV